MLSQILFLTVLLSNGINKGYQIYPCPAEPRYIPV